jgi:hypothetical protein
MLISFSARRVLLAANAGTLMSSPGSSSRALCSQLLVIFTTLRADTVISRISARDLQVSLEGSPCSFRLASMQCLGGLKGLQ